MRTTLTLKLDLRKFFNHDNVHAYATWHILYIQNIDHIHVAYMLKKKILFSETITIERSFLPFLRPGEPNLLLCNQSKLVDTKLTGVMGY